MEGQGLGKTERGTFFPRHQYPCLIVLVGKLPLVSRCASWLFSHNFPPTHSVSRELCALMFRGQSKLGGRSCSHALLLTSPSGTDVHGGANLVLGLQNWPRPSLSGPVSSPNVPYLTYTRQRWRQGAPHPNASSEGDKTVV